MTRRGAVRAIRTAAGGLAVLLAAGCSSATAGPGTGQQVAELVKSAYHQTREQGSVAASVTETVGSGVDTITQGTGTVTWEFPRRTGETQLTVDGTTHVVAVRVADTFYEARTRAALKGTGRDLVRTGGQDPGSMPQITAPGLDPFQLTTLLDAVSWPDALATAQPVVTSDDTGTHTRYQLGVDTARLATHEPAADRTWLTQMSRQQGGAVVSVVATVDRGRLTAVSAQLPVPQPRSLAKTTVPSGLPSPNPVTVLVSAQFDYTKRPAPVTVPS